MLILNSSRLGSEIGFNKNLTKPSDLRDPEKSKREAMTNLERLYIRIFGYPDTIKQQQARVFFSILKKINFKNVLDIGCAHGYYSMRIAKNYPNSHVIGIDILEPEIKIAKETSKLLDINNATFKTFNLFKIKTQKRYDLILLFQVLDFKNDVNALKTIRNLLSIDGKLILTIPNKNAEIIKWGKKYIHIDTHERLGYKKEELKNIFKEANLEIKKIIYLSGIFGSMIEKFGKILQLHNIYLYAILYPFLNLILIIDDVKKKSEKNTSGMLVIANPI